MKGNDSRSAIRRTRVAAATAVAALAVAAPAATAATEVVKPSSPHGWAIASENTAGGTGAFVAGPGTPPAGTGSVRFTLANSTQGMILAKAIPVTRFADFTTLSYSAHRTSPATGILAPALQFDVDYDSTDTDTSFQGRLVFEPHTLGPVPAGAWNTYDALAGKWFSTRAPFNALCSQASPCTRSQVLNNWPHVATSGLAYLKAGGGWASFNGNVDNLTIDGTTYDFEPEVQCTADCYVDASTGNDAYGGGDPAFPKKTIQAALSQVSPNGTVHVASGTYNEDAALSKPGVDLVGAGADTTTILGKLGGSFNTLELSAQAVGASVEGLTITRDGNTVAQWPLGTLNNQGLAVYAKGATIRENTITGNRNGVYVGGSSAQNITFERNVIDFNRTGLHLVNDVSGLVVRNNRITNNWTMGVLLRDELGLNPNPTAAITVEDNDISGNWFSQIEARSKFLPAATLDMEGNWLGSADAPVAVGAPTSGEPSYVSQIPVLFGGTAVGTALPATGTLVWNNVLNTANPVDADPWQCTGDDADAATPGFQPAGPLPATFFRDLDGDGLGDAGSTADACSVPAGYVTNDEDTNDDPDKYELSTFRAPINSDVANAAKAGQNVPVKLRVLDSTGAPVTTDPGLEIAVDSIACGGTGGADAIETYAAQSSDWTHAGDGVWQLNWKTLKSMAGGCRTLSVDVAGPTDAVSALFAFK